MSITLHPSHYTGLFIFLIALLLTPCGSLISQHFVECTDITEIELPDDPTLCEEITDFDSDPITIGTFAHSIKYWSTDGLGFPTQFGVNGLDIVINCTLIIDEPAGFNNCRIKMAPGSRIIVQGGTFLLSLNSSWFCCDGMWTGIEVNTNADLRCIGSRFEDARYLINAYDKARLTLYGNTFNRNYVGIHNLLVSNQRSGITFNFFALNHFTCTSELNDQSYGPPISYAGIHIENGVLSLGGGKGTTEASQWPGPNYFEYLRNGIVLDESTAQVTNMHFDKMIDVGITYSGHGIALVNSNLTVSAGYINNNWYGRSTFNDCTSVGILGRNSSAVIVGSIFSGIMAGCVEFENNLLSQYVTIRKCRFELDDPGVGGAIWIDRGVGTGDLSHYVIAEDTLIGDDVYDLAATSGYYFRSLYAASDEQIIEGNYSYLDIGTDAMYVIRVDNGFNYNYKINDNYIECVGSNKTEIGITCLQGYVPFTGIGNEINNNTVIGASNYPLHTGIYLDAFSGTQLCNNHTDYSTTGFYFINTIWPCEITENDIDHHDNGFLIKDGGYSNGQIVGPQTRRNNIWGSSGYYAQYAAQCLANPARNVFKVQNSNTGILPTPIDPSGSVWFQVVSGDPNACGENTDPDKISYVDSLLIEGDDFHGVWSSAILWSANLQLMLKLIRNPSMRPTGSDAESYYTNNSSESYALHARAISHYMDALISSSSHTASDSTYDIVQSWVDSLASYQSYSRPLDTLVLDTFYVNHIDSLLDTLIVETNMDSYFRDQIKSDQATALATVLYETTLLPVDSTYELYSQKTLKILIESIIDDSLSSAALLTLDTIASTGSDTSGISSRIATIILGPCFGNEPDLLSLVNDSEEIVTRNNSNYKLSSLEMHVSYSYSDHTLKIIWSNSIQGVVEIVDISGRAVCKEHVTDQISKSIPLEVPAGVYVACFYNQNGEVLSKKFVID